MAMDDQNRGGKLANKMAASGFVFALIGWVALGLLFVGEWTKGADYDTQELALLATSLILSIILQLLGFGFSMVALERSKKAKSGRGLAMAGIILSSLYVLLLAILILLSMTDDDATAVVIAAVCILLGLGFIFSITRLVRTDELDGRMKSMVAAGIIVFVITGALLGLVAGRHTPNLAAFGDCYRVETKKSDAWTEFTCLNQAGERRPDSDRPAMIVYYENGSRSESYYQNDELHRGSDQPAKVWYREDGSEREAYYQNGEIHREGNQPAEISYREDGLIKYEAYYQNGRQHRVGDQPAEIRYWEDGSIEYEAYYRHDQLHREGNQPAEIRYYRDGSISDANYHLNGISVDENGRPLPILSEWF